MYVQQHVLLVTRLVSRDAGTGCLTPAADAIFCLTHTCATSKFDLLLPFHKYAKIFCWKVSEMTWRERQRCSSVRARSS